MELRFVTERIDEDAEGFSEIVAPEIVESRVRLGFRDQLIGVELDPIGPAVFVQ